MRLFICGQKFFGQKVLEMCLGLGHEVIGVSAPEGDRLWSSARKNGVRWLIPGGSLRADVMPDGADLIIAAHSYDFISSKTLSKTKLGGIGYHPSLLPLHRGRDAVRWAITMGDKVTGGSVYWLTKAVDGGPIAAQDWCFIHPGVTERQLWREALQPMGLRLFSQVLKDLSAGRIIAVPQDERVATWEPGFTQEPIFRPDLPQIGPLPEGFRLEVPKKESAGSDILWNGDWRAIAGG